MSKKKTGFRRRQSTIVSPTIPARSIQRKQWTDSEMLAAIEDVKQGMSCNHAAYTWGTKVYIKRSYKWTSYTWEESWTGALLIL